MPLIESFVSEDSKRDQVTTSQTVLIILLALITILWIVSDKKRKTLSFLSIIEIVVFFLICMAAIWCSGGIESTYKFIFIPMIALYTIENNTRVGMVIAGGASFSLLAVDLLLYTSENTVNKFFESDLVLSAVFMIVAWVLGYYVQTTDRLICDLRDDINRDGLTKAYNHRCFYDSLARECERAEKFGNPLSLVMIDVDAFKLYNDMYGHQRGDEVLLNVTNSLQKCLEGEATLYRYGGDEFAAILPNFTLEDATDLAEKMRESIGNTDFFGMKHLPNEKISITVGVSEYRHGEGDGIKDLIERADNALYRGKFLHRDSVEVYSSVFDEIANENDDQSDKIRSIKQLITIINARDSYTFNHVERVVYITDEFAKFLGLSQDDTRKLVFAAYLHDLGKINIPKEVLISDTKLTDEEWDLLRKHPADSVDILRGITGFADIIPIVLAHHERWDGKGYPQSLGGESIPYLARVLTLCDSYDAMTSKRPYKKPLSKANAIDEIIRCKGSQFDPELTDKFIEFIKDLPERAER